MENLGQGTHIDKASYTHAKCFPNGFDSYQLYTRVTPSSTSSSTMSNHTLYNNYYFGIAFSKFENLCIAQKLGKEPYTFHTKFLEEGNELCRMEN